MLDTSGIMRLLRLITGASDLTPPSPCSTIPRPVATARDESEQPSQRVAAGFLLPATLEGNVKTDTPTRTCDHCGDPLPWSRLNAANRDRIRFCSKQCSQAHFKQQMKAAAGTEHWARLSPGTSGALAELVACADLMARGYEVFRAQSPSCSCDVVAIRDGKVHRVEVRSGYKHQDGTIHTALTRLDPAKYDVLAIVHAGREVVYEPPLD